MKTKLVFFLSAGDSRGQKVSGGGGSGFCGTVKRDVTCSRLFLLPEAWCHIHPGWVFLAYLPTHLPGWLYGKRGEFCTVLGGRDRCYPGGDRNVCPRADGEPATAGVLSYCPPPSTCSPKENLLPSAILCWQWNVRVVLETGMWEILNPCPLQWGRTPRGLCYLLCLCSLPIMLRASVFMVDMLYCSCPECSLVHGQGCHPPLQGGPIQPGLEQGIHSCPGQPVPVPQHPLSEEHLPAI